MDPHDSIWHYPRNEVAEDFLAQVDRGLFNIFVLFERRRQGKTELMLYDVARLAAEHNYRVLYINLWSSDFSPAGQLALAFTQALKNKSFAERAKETLLSPISKLKVSGEWLGTKGEVEIDLAEGTEPKTHASLVSVMNAAAEQLFSKRQKTLLLIDEIQALATSKQNIAVARALRTLLETYRNKAAAICSGSSREGLHAVFSNEKAAFFRSGKELHLPPMDDGFVEHLVGVATGIAKAPPSLPAALAAFQDLNRNPAYFRDLLDLGIDFKEPDLRKLLPLLRERIQAKYGYATQWRKLKPLERALVLAVAEGETDLYAARLRSEYLPGTEAVAIPAVQTAVRRLLRADILIKRQVAELDRRSDYGLNDEEFGAWALFHHKDAD